MDAQLKGQSGTVLEQTTSSDGLVQLVSRERKPGDGPESIGGKGSGLFASRTTLIPPLGEDDEDEHSRSGTSSGTPLASVLVRAQTPEIRRSIPEGIARPGEPRDVKHSTSFTRPDHIDLPPPPDLKTLLTPQKTPSPSANRPSPLTDITPGLQVLVVDDDKMTRMLFQRMLGRLKCQVTTAVNGYEALRLLMGDNVISHTPAEEHEHPFSDGEDHMSIIEMEKMKGEKESKFAIVFLDNQMPVMSGVEMVRKLRTSGRKDLVVGVTGEFSLFSSQPPMGGRLRYLIIRIL